MPSLKEIIREADLLGSPVHLTYKGRSQFKTVCGGCITIILGFIILAYILDMTNVLFRYPTYTKLEVTDVVPSYENDASFEVDTSYTTVAI